MRRRKSALIKSNNPHLAGGEQSDIQKALLRETEKKQNNIEHFQKPRPQNCQSIPLCFMIHQQKELQTQVDKKNTLRNR